MLWLEREVVRRLVADQPAALRRGVEQYVDESLRDMPEVLRLGVAGESVVLGALTRLASWRAAITSNESDAVARRLEKCRASRISVIRQYERLLGSLVTFASCELAAEPEGHAVRQSLPAIA